MPRNQEEAPVMVMEDENSAHLYPKRLSVPSPSIFEDDYCICGIDTLWRKVFVMALDSLTRHDSFSDYAGVQQVERLIKAIEG